MKIEKTDFEGVYLIKSAIFSDYRGKFVKTINEDIYKQLNLNIKFVESYYSISLKNVIRGMHFQLPPFQHNKLVYVNKGSIIDVVLDLRKASPTYGKYFTFELNDINCHALYISEGLAHGFLSLEDDTMVTYNQTTCYTPQHDGGIRFDSFGFDWLNCNAPIVSERDTKFLSFTEFKSPF